MAANWYVLSIKPHKERSVHHYLQTEQIESYYPTMRVKPVNPRSRRERPYFPGYMFVNVDLQRDGDNRLRWVPGTRGLVRFDDVPALVPESLIDEVRKKLERRQELQNERRALQKGDRVHIVAGPFAGYEAIFDAHLSGQDRVQVLLAYLNHQSHRLRLSSRDLEKII